MTSENLLTILDEVSTMHKTAEKLAHQVKYLNKPSSKIVNSTSFFNAPKKESQADAYDMNLSLLAELKNYLQEFVALKPASLTL